MMKQFFFHKKTTYKDKKCRAELSDELKDLFVNFKKRSMMEKFRFTLNIDLPRGIEKPMKKKIIISCLLLFAFCSQLFAQIDKGPQLDFSKYTDSVEIFKKKLETDPRNISLLFGLANAYAATVQNDKALLCYDRIIAADPGNHRAYFEKGNLYNYLNMLTQALEEFNQAIKLKGLGEYYFERGVVLQVLKENEKAVDDFKSALRENFEAPQLYNNYAIILYAKGDFEKALEMVNNAVRLNDKYPQALSVRARIRFTLLQIDSACSDANTAYTMGHKTGFSLPGEICSGTEREKLRFASTILAQDKFYEAAIKGFNRLIELEPDSFGYYQDRGYCYYQLKEYDKAEENYLKAISLAKPPTDLLYNNISLLYFDMGKHEKSIEFSSKRIQLDPSNHVAYLDRGLAHRKLKKYKKAEEDFNKSLSLKPDFFRAFGYRGFLYLETGKYQLAYEDAKKAVSINPEYAYGYLVLGQAKQQLSMPDFCNDFHYAKKYGSAEVEENIKKYCK
jgi:tetratricopeptide (TPR) repeat protein